jgi:hypothetical protein
MKPASKTRLSLSTETVRTLSNDELIGVAGGLSTISITCTISVMCSTGPECKPPARNG